MDTKPLTKTQKQILTLLYEHGNAIFQGQKGRVGMERTFKSFVHDDYGLVIEAYQTPEIFLQRRGFISRIEGSNMPGRRYGLTLDGLERARALL